MTGLSQETSEAFQVQSYGVGGYYQPHYDHKVKGETVFGDAGNRIATVMFYVIHIFLNFKQKNEKFKYFSFQMLLKEVQQFFLT